MKNLIKPENEAEARALQSLLEERGIRVEVVSFHDTAYDGLFQAQYGWGVIRVDESVYKEALMVVQDWTTSSPGEDVPWESDQDQKG